MEGGIWGDGVYAFSSSEKPFICFAPRWGPEFQLVKCGFYGLSRLEISTYLRIDDFSKF
jgi:hypothetical protein